MIKYVNGKPTSVPNGMLAREHLGLMLELQVMKSQAGYYLGTADDGGPVSRESLEYWPNEHQAENALNGKQDWTQKLEP